MLKNKNTGFTLIEVLILVLVVAVMITMAIGPSLTSSFYRARDSRRKADLKKTANLLEDYYNDYSSYPPALFWGEDFPPYVNQLPKDPRGTGAYGYNYQTDPVSGQFFAVFAILENADDPDISASGCSSGCGPGLNYNYAVLSPNARLVNGMPEI